MEIDFYHCCDFFPSFFCPQIYTISISCIIHIASVLIQSVNMKQV